MWTWRGLVTYFTVFAIDPASRLVHMLGSTPNAKEAFMRQVARTLRFADTPACRVLICDRDAKWSPAFEAGLADAGQQPQGDAVVPWEQMVAEHHCGFWAQLGY